ncbi:MAG: hypothetical protein QW327_01885 [Candidatus Odinarchaeota archaeon]
MIIKFNKVAAVTRFWEPPASLFQYMTMDIDGPKNNNETPNLKERLAVKKILADKIPVKGEISQLDNIMMIKGSGLLTALKNSFLHIFQHMN